MTSDQDTQDLIKRVTEAAVKAVSARDNVTVSFAPGAHGITQSQEVSQARLPTPIRTFSEKDLNVLRGEADAVALRLRYNDVKTFHRQRPVGGNSAELFDTAEQVRVEALGSRVLAGVEANLDQYHESRCKDKGYHLVTEREESQKQTDQMIIEKLGTSNATTKSVAWISGTIAGPIISFFKKNGFSIALGILGFVFLFKIGEAFLGRMSIVFYKEIGFSKGQIAIYSKGLGWITTVVFTLLGGIMAMRAGTIKTMFFAGGLMALTNLLFAFLAWTGKSELLFAVAVIADDITAAFATVAFVAFISLLVDRAYTATQYALLASIGTAGRTTLASSSGALVDWLNGDWGTFFVLTTMMVIPSLICLWLIKNKIKIGAK